MILDRPIAFLTTNDAASSRTFYQDVLGLEFVADEPFAVVFRVGGVLLRIQKVQDMALSVGTVFGFDVDDIRSAVGELQGKAVAFERFERMEQDDLGVWHSPGGAKVAWFRDPVGNLLSLTQSN